MREEKFALDQSFFNCYAWYIFKINLSDAISEPHMTEEKFEMEVFKDYLITLILYLKA